MDTALDYECSQRSTSWHALSKLVVLVSTAMFMFFLNLISIRLKGSVRIRLRKYVTNIELEHTCYSYLRHVTVKCVMQLRHFVAA